MKQYITIGRSSHCDIIVSDERVSREHARISISGNMYIYENLGSNGSVINGQLLSSGRVTVAPGTPILMAGRTTLPWQQVFSLLPLKGVRVSSPQPKPQPQPQYQPQPQQQPYYDQQPAVDQRGLNFGLGLLSFIFPIVGWIFYFVWKHKVPRRSHQAGVLAWIGFAANIFCSIVSFALS